MAPKRKRSKPRPETLLAVQLRQVKQLRSDARKLDAISKHLRAQAQEIADSIRAEKRAEQARTNFYSKGSKIDSSLTLTPIEPAEPGSDKTNLSEIGF